MKKRNFTIAGIILILIAAAYAVIALSHPELSFPWKNWVSYTIYALYAIYTVLIFLMPRFEGASLSACLIAAVDFVAMALLAIFAGTRGTEGDYSMLLPLALFLSCGANFANLGLKKKRNKENEK